MLGIDSRAFEDLIHDHKQRLGKADDPALTAAEWEAVTADFKKLIFEESGQRFPEDPHEQLERAIKAVFDSWHGRRAVDYRNFHRLPHDWGTACNIQTMVFGNMGEQSGTGVAFTRNPNDGSPELFGEYLLNAQGEDVVAGIRTPEQISTLRETLPEVYLEFQSYAHSLEAHTPRCRTGVHDRRRPPLHAADARRKAQPGGRHPHRVDMVHEGKIDRETAVRRVEAEQVSAMLHPRIDSSVPLEAIARGLNASPGAATGEVVFTADDAAALAEEGRPVILVRPETSPTTFTAWPRHRRSSRPAGARPATRQSWPGSLGCPPWSAARSLRSTWKAAYFGRAVRKLPPAKRSPLTAPWATSFAARCP